jgi:hypothetical protein
MTKLSDEVKLAIIKNELDNVMMGVKMLITIQATIEAQRRLMADELDGDWKVVAESPDFKAMFNAAAEAFGEVVRNLSIFTDNIAQVFDFSFVDSLPENKEDFEKMTRELAEQAEKYNGVE